MRVNGPFVVPLREDRVVFSPETAEAALHRDIATTAYEVAEAEFGRQLAELRSCKDKANASLAGAERDARLRELEVIEHAAREQLAEAGERLLLARARHHELVSKGSLAHSLELYERDQQALREAAKERSRSTRRARLSLFGQASR